MGLMRVGVVLCVSSMLLLEERADCTTHPRVKMYGPKLTVIDRRKPEAIVRGEVVKTVPEPPPPLAVEYTPADEPSCLELRLLWRSSQRQNRVPAALRQSADGIVPMPFDPFVFSAWDEYVKPRYAGSRREPTFERAVPPDRYHVYRQLRPFEKIARLATTTRAILEDRLQPRNGANLFRLGFPLTKVPVISMRLTAKDRFEELKEILRLDKAQRYGTPADGGDDDDDDDDGPYSVLPVAEAAADTADKKRPVYETLMSRPRHFSQGHYMNVKPGGGGGDVDADNDPNATDSPKYKSSPLVKSWNSRW